MNEREIAEKILKMILEKEKLGTATINAMCVMEKANETIVYQFLKEHTTRGNGFGDNDDMLLTKGSANFVYSGCWSGEEKRKRKENMINRGIVILAAAIGALVGIIGTLMVHKC